MNVAIPSKWCVLIYTIDDDDKNFIMGAGQYLDSQKGLNVMF